MAFRATGHWKSMITPLGRTHSRSFASSTTPKLKQYSTTANAAHNPRPYNKYSISGEYAPVYIVMGMLVVAISIAAHTAKQHLMHAPGVVISKKKRESISEADHPDQALASADKFLNKSFLRKVAHIQDNKRTLPDPSRPDPFTRPRTAETLKTVGVDPSHH
ncbi:PREDICTED: uncharacterized protein LOC18608803 [Theobroma cacao]|nr:PREDICTED: uncharacterized protein LOC18608803 [Theobroma cacao]